MNRVNHTSGFTIIELLLAMSFVSILLLAIAATVIQLGNIYNKGLTLKAVDQAGRTITTDLRQTIGQTQPFDTASVFRNQPADIRNTSAESEGGRLCTGTYTYIWNLGRVLDNEKRKPVNTYANSDAEIRFARVRDNGGQYCSDDNLSSPIDPKDATELLSAGDRQLAVQSFEITPLASDPTLNQAMYYITMKIGTNDQAALDTINGSCKPPEESQSNQDFCAVNQFEFTVQAGNKGGQ